MSFNLNNQTRLCISKARVIEVTTERRITDCQLTARNGEIVCPLLQRNSIVLIQLTVLGSKINLYRQRGVSRFQVANYHFAEGCDVNSQGDYHCILQQ